MPVEEQTQYDRDYVLYSGVVRKNGQKLTIVNRKLTKLAFYVKRTGLPSGNVHYAIRRTSDDNLIIDEIVCTADEIGTVYEWKEHEWTTPPTINEEVRIYAYVEGGTSGNSIDSCYQDTDVKGGEYRTGSYATTWFDREGEDTTYRYTYGEEAAVELENKSANMGAKMIAGKLI